MFTVVLKSAFVTSENFLNSTKSSNDHNLKTRYPYVSVLDSNEQYYGRNFMKIVENRRLDSFHASLKKTMFLLPYEMNSVERVLLRHAQDLRLHIFILPFAL